MKPSDGSLSIKSKLNKCFSEARHNENFRHSSSNYLLVRVEYIKYLKEQELFLIKSKQNQGGGSSGTPIEENKKTLEQDFGRSR
jgi:hypothetical protein